MTIQYTLVGTEDGSNISVFVPGYTPMVAHSSHPNFEEILAGVRIGDENVVRLFDIAQTAADKFERLTERITFQSGHLFLDGVEIHDACAQQIVRFLRDGVEDWLPLVAFYENVVANPSEHSRNQLYSWLDNRDFTITPSGMLVGYKGVHKLSDGSLVSINHGRAIVDGEVKNGAIPNAIGSVVEMPRDQVEFNPAIDCHRGLHVGTYNYANGFARGALLEVHVNPRDVVSVPTDCNAEKMRVCRYRVVDVIDRPYTSAVWRDWDYDDDYDDWGDDEGDDLY